MGPAEARPAGGEPLEVLVVRPTLGQGGADRVTVTLLRALDRRRFRPSLALMQAQGELLAELPAEVPVHELGASSLWTAWWPLARLLRRRPPQVLLSTSSGANLIAVVAHLLCRRRMRLVLSERTVLLRRPLGPKRRLQLALKRRLYPRADCVTAVSRAVADELVGRLGLPAARVRVVYNPVVTPELAGLAAAEAPHPWLAGPLPVLMGAGRMVPAKGFELLLAAFARLPERLPARLVLLGEGPLRRPLERQAAALGVGDRVCFAGFDPNPLRYLSRATVFVLSSLWEGLPGALIQAMACSVPVVATDCPGGVREIVDDGVNGFLVAPGDADRLVARIVALLDDPQLRRRFGRQARRTARRFSLGPSLDRYAAALAGDPEPRPAKR